MSDSSRSGAPIVVSPSGASGLLRVSSASAVDRGIIRVGFGLDFFAVGTFFERDDNHNRVGAILSLSGAPTDYLEAWLNVRATSNRNDSTEPTLLQAQGDIALGVKGFYPITDMISLGADAQLTFLSGIGASAFELSATEVRLRALMTTDFTRGDAPLPLRGHVNVGYVFDNSDNLLVDGTELTQAERFALGINEYSRLSVGLGVEAPLRYVTPYIEYTAEFPVSPQYLATPGIVAAGRGLSVAQVQPTDITTQPGRPAYQRIVPQVITPGIRVTAIPKLTIDLAVEIGITPDEVVGVPSVPPYNVVLFASYPLDPFGVQSVSGPPISVPVVIPEAVDPASETGSLTGRVTDKATSTPVAGAVVRFDRAPPVATAESGRFRSLPMAPGPVQVTIVKDGFEPTTTTVDIAADQEPEIVVELEPALSEGTIRGRVTDDRDQPLAGATVTIDGPESSTVTTDAEGRFEATSGAGEYTLQIKKDEYLAKAKTFALRDEETITVDVVLRRRPEKELIEIRGDRLLLQGKVHFVMGEARLEANAETLLDNVVDFLVREPSVNVRIEGHTDNVGSKKANQELSLQRAEAVKAYLTRNGIMSDRLTTEGFGSGRPLAPNLTRRGREQNRRVEFHIVK